MVVGGNPVELAGDGVFLPHDERYAQAEEFLTIWRGLLSGETVDFDGKYYRVEGGRLDHPAVQRPHPPLYFGGSSDAGQDLAAEQCDTLSDLGRAAGRGRRKDRGCPSARRRRGRKLRFGIRLHFIVRETEEEAWAAADRLISKVSDAQIAAAQAASSRRWTRSASAAWPNCMVAVATSSWCRRTSGPVSAWCAAAPERRWSARRSRSPSGCANTRRRASSS